MGFASRKYQDYHGKDERLLKRRPTGPGFAVVADEVRALTERTTRATISAQVNDLTAELEQHVARFRLA